jgi:hypothetical protein
MGEGVKGHAVQAEWNWVLGTGGQATGIPSRSLVGMATTSRTFSKASMSEVVLRHRRAKNVCSASEYTAARASGREASPWR